MKAFLKINDQITLHLPRPEIAEDVFQTIDSQRTYLRQWLPWVDGTQTVNDTLAYMKEAIKKNTTGQQLNTYIYNGLTFAGSISFVHLDKDTQTGEIGYWLHQNMQQQGIMTQTCQRFIDYAFRTKALNRIEIRVISQNLKSQAIPKRLGFSHEGTMREGLIVYKEFHDLELFSLLRREWESNKNPA